MKGTNSKEVVFTLIPPDDHRIEKGAVETKKTKKEKYKSRINSHQQQNIHESVDDYENSHQSRQQQDNITSLLQVTDSDSDDSDCDDDNSTYIKFSLFLFFSYNSNLLS